MGAKFSRFHNAAPAGQVMTVMGGETDWPSRHHRRWGGGWGGWYAPLYAYPYGYPYSFPYTAPIVAPSLASYTAQQLLDAAGATCWWYRRRTLAGRMQTLAVGLANLTGHLFVAVPIDALSLAKDREAISLCTSTSRL